MKTTIYKIGVLIVMLSFFSSCEDSLNTELKGSFINETFYVTQENAIMAVNAAYRPLSFATDGRDIWVIGDTRSDDAVKGGDAGDKADAGDIDNFIENTNNGVVASVWGNYYEGITRCNAAIANVNAMSDDLFDSGIKDRIIGEAKFLRAYYYFQLVNIWGDVPVLLEPKLPNELQIAPSASSVIYAQIEKDCEEAQLVLPVSYDLSNVGRATKGAAIALLAKSYLYQEKWPQAYETALLLTKDPYAYELMPNYQFNYNANYENNLESIFEVQHLRQQNPNSGNQLTQSFGPPFDYGMGEGYYFNQPTQNFVDEFETTTDVTGLVFTDPRLDYSIGRENAQLPWIDDTITYSSAWTETGYIVKKYLQPISELPVNMNGDGDLNYTAIRYDDVLLWIAEAYNEDGKPDMALGYLNAIRKRARECFQTDQNLFNYPNIPAGLLDEISDVNQSTLRDKIRHERRVEFGFEFHRYFDIMRYGEDYANDVFKDVEYFDYQQHRYLPYPQKELDTNYELRNYTRK